MKKFNVVARETRDCRVKCQVEANSEVEAANLVRDYGTTKWEISVEVTDARISDILTVEEVKVTVFHPVGEPEITFSLEERPSQRELDFLAGMGVEIRNCLYWNSVTMLQSQYERWQKWQKQL